MLGVMPYSPVTPKRSAAAVAVRLGSWIMILVFVGIPDIDAERVPALRGPPNGRLWRLSSLRSHLVNKH